MSNELGAGNLDRAKHAMAVTLKITDCLALAVVLLLALCHNIWASFFSDSTVIIKDYAYMVPLLVASILLDSTQGVLSCINDPYPPHRSLFISPFCLDVTGFCWSMGGKRMWLAAYGQLGYVLFDRQWHAHRSTPRL